MEYMLRMSSVAEIEAAIAKLPPREFGQLERWFDAERNRKWYRQIEEDAQSGKLRNMYERLQAKDNRHADVPRVSARVLKMLDKSADNLKKGVASPPIDLASL
jgi:hypothetical protein